MARVIPPGFAEARIVMSATGDPRPWTVTLGIDVSDAGGDYEGVADKVRVSYAQSFLIGQSTLVRLDSVELLIGQDGGDPLTVSSPASSSGGTASAMLPQNCAVLVQKRSGVAGKRNRGRMFIPLMAREAQVDGVGVIDADERDAYQVTADLFLEKLLSDEPGTFTPAPPVILHTAGVGVDPTPTPITRFIVDPVIATQRRRLRS